MSLHTFAQMGPSTIATVASGLAPPLQTRPDELIPYALAFRFTLEIDGINTGWQSCKGLSVDYAPSSVSTGGGYTTSLYLPGAVKFPKVILSRAIVADDAIHLQKWLVNKAGEWMQPLSAGSDWLKAGTTHGSEAKITLYDSYGKPVMAWHLHGARPSSWNGPELNATSSQIALETLELVHEGFEVSVGDASSPVNSISKSQSPQPMTLKCLDSKTTVEFHNPPETIGIKRVQRKENLGTGGVEAALNVGSYSVKKLLITGGRIKDSVGLLNMWATKRGKKGSKVASQPVLELKWGSGFRANGQLTALNITYTRFLADGTPIVASVDLDLEEVAGAGDGGGGGQSNPCADSGKRSNPSSGGIPGRASHQLVAAEDLPSLAQSTYGKPQMWRDIATANSLDDPFRVPPGTRLYLPAIAELTA